MDVQTYNGEILASWSFADFLANDYDPNPDDVRLAKLVARGYRRLFCDGCGGALSRDDVPGTLFRYVTGSDPRWTELAVNNDHTCEEEPLILAGPWPRRGETGESDRWAVLVWVNVGYLTTTSLPDYCIVTDGEYDSAAVADLNGQGDIGCTECEAQWEYPGAYGDRPYERLASHDGARCPECGAGLAVGFSVGENGYYASEGIPWNGGEPCPECNHADHFGRECDGWPDECGCPWPYDRAEDIPPLPRRECDGQQFLAELRLSLALA